MELKYIWVKEYNNIKELGFNFNNSGVHSFSYDGHNLEIIQKSESIIDFGENIHSITAIAGENGSGKSSLCEIIIEAIATKSNGAIGWNFPFEGIVCIDNFIFYHTNIELGNFKNENFKLVRYDETPFNPSAFKFDEFKKTGFIYYSNVIDNRSDFRSVSLTNISTEYFIVDSLWKNSKDKSVGLDEFNREESYRIANFYLNFKDECPFTGPDEMRVSPNFSGNNRHLALGFWDDDFKHLRYLNEWENSILADIYPYKNISDEDNGKVIELDEINLKQNIESLYRINLLLVLSRDILQEDIQVVSEFVFKGEIKDEFFKDTEKVVELLNYFSKLLIQGKVISSFNPNHYIFGTEIKEWRHEILSFSVENNEGTRSTLRKIIDLEEDLLRDENQSFLRINDYNFESGISSGERSFLVLYSRLFELLNRKKNHLDLVEEYIVLLDEPEIGFHPTWKKKFLKWLLKFLNSSFHNYKFQVIITSHSPYLLSDLPSENVLLLRKRDDGKCKIENSETIKTFGANIHELLSDSFFLKDGLIGEFAKDKVNSLYRYLRPDGINDSGWTKENSLKLINQIGEAIVRSHLLQLYDAKFRVITETEYIDSEIKRLQERRNQILGGQS